MAGVIVVAGWLQVAVAERDAYLAGCRDVVAAARDAPGCLDFNVSADLLDPARIRVFEQWESAEAVERFRGSGPSDEQAVAIVAAHVEQHEIATSTSLT